MNRPLLKQARDALLASRCYVDVEGSDAELDVHLDAIAALDAELAKPDQDSGKVIGELDRLYKNALKREFDLSQALEAAVDNNIDKLMSMSDDQVRALAGFEGHNPDDLAALARQTFEIALLKAELAKPKPEPVGYVYWNKGHAEGALDNQNMKPGTPLYAAPTEPNFRFPTCRSQEFQSKLADEVASELVTGKGCLYCNSDSSNSCSSPEVHSQIVKNGGVTGDGYCSNYQIYGPRKGSESRNCSRHPDAPHGPDGAGCKCHSWAPGEAS